MAKRDKYDDDSIFSTPENNPALFRSLLGLTENFYKTRNKYAEKYGVEEIRDQLRRTKKGTEERLKLEQKLRKTITKAEKDAADATRTLWANSYKQATATRKAEMLKQKVASLKNEQEQVKEQLRMSKVVYGKNSAQAKKLEKELENISRNKARYEVLQAQKVRREEKRINDLKKQDIANQQKEIDDIQKNGLLHTALFSRQLSKKEREERARNIRDQLAEQKNAVEKTEKEIAEIKQKYDEEAAVNGEDSAKEKYGVDLQTAQDRLSGEKGNLEALQKLANTVNTVNRNVEMVQKNIQSAYNAFTGKAVQSMNKAEQVMVNYQSRVNASLQGSDKDFESMMDMVTTNLAISSSVKMEEVIDNIKKASDSGIVYNIEQRAFLESVSDKIAHTFDAFDSNLTRLIRLQQADTTAARLGMEASLTKLFNSTFSDSSYLSDVYDSVSQAIIDANSQMTRDQSAEFEYTLQKWLGSLYSLGMSNSAVTEIAQGVNYLATGDVTSLASNTSLQTLMAMSASNAGLDYAQILLNGLDASTTNKLLESMVLYLKDIAENSDSQVVKSAYGDIFNMSLSDMKAISNLTAADISSISSTNMSYGGMLNETNNQLQMIRKRSAASENIQNIYDNVLFGMGMNMVNSPATWVMKKMLDFMDDTGLKINIPTLGVMGNFLGLNTDVNSLLNLGLGLSGAMSLVGTVLSSIANGNGLSLDKWGGTEYTQRGTGMGNLLSTMTGETSSSTFVSNTTSTDMTNSALASATDDAQNTTKITNKNVAKTDHQLDDFWNAIIGDAATDFVKSQDVVLQRVYDNNTGSILVHDSAMSEYFDILFGNQSITSQGYLRTIDFGIEQSREGSFLRVHDTNAANLGLLSFDSSRALRTTITNQSITTKISNAADIANSMAQTKPQQMTLAPNTTVNIGKSALVAAILEALGGTEGNIKLKQFVEGALQGSNGTTPPTIKVRNADSGDLNVRVSNYQLFNL